MTVTCFIVPMEWRGFAFVVSLLFLFRFFVPLPFFLFFFFF